MKRTFLLTLILLLTVPTVFAAQITYEESINDIADMFSEVLGRNTRVTFVSFDSDSESFSARFISDIEKALVNRDCIVLNRSNQDAMMKELEFQTSGLVDDNQAVSIGHMLGADMIIAGSGRNETGSYHIDLQLVDLSTTLVRRHATYDLVLDTDLRNILKGSSSSIGNQKIGVAVRLGYNFGFNKAHVDMVGEGFTGKEESMNAVAPALSFSYRVLETLRLQVELDFMIGNGITVSGMGETVSVTYSTLDIPLIVSWNAIQSPLTLDIFGGAYVSLPISQVTVTQSNGAASVKLNGKVLGVLGGINVGYPVGPGYAVVDIRYINDFGTLTVTQTSGGVDSEAGLCYRKGLVISLGYSLNLQ
jgi:TolB-like protein